MTTARSQMAYGVPDAYEALIAPRYAPVADALVELAAPAAGARVLELGAGTGLVTRRLNAALVVATDKYEHMLSVGRAATTNENVVWLVADYNDPLPFADGSFELVISGLTYAQDTRETVGEIFRVVAPGGRIALSMWASEYLEFELMNRAKERVGEPPIPAPDPAAAAERLAGAGFDDVQIRELELAPTYPSVDDYLAYRRGFGTPVGSDPEQHERYLEALCDEAAARANADGSFTQGWRFALLSGRRPA